LKAECDRGAGRNHTTLVPRTASAQSASQAFSEAVRDAEMGGSLATWSRRVRLGVSSLRS